MKIELVIFDCDGVLVDSETIANKIMAEELTRIGLPTTYEESIRDYMGKSLADGLKLITDRLGSPPPKEYFERSHKRSVEAFEKELKPIPGIFDALNQISIKKCVASSGSHEKIRKTLGITKLLPFFEGKIFSAVDVKKGKPNPDLFLFAAQHMGVPPEYCVVVEDSLPGVQAARAAGMKVFGYQALTSAEVLLEAGAYVFEDMKLLPGLLDQ